MAPNNTDGCNPFPRVLKTSPVYAKTIVGPPVRIPPWSRVARLACGFDRTSASKRRCSYQLPTTGLLSPHSLPAPGPTCQIHQPLLRLDQRQPLYYTQRVLTDRRHEKYSACP